MADINELIKVPVDIEPISFDYETMKARLTDMLEPYKGLVVTEDNYSLCKEKKNEVGRISKELDDTRKEIKKLYEKPLKEFEKDIKSLVAMADRVKKNISEQLDVFDDQRRAEKRQIAESVMDEVIAEYELNEKYAGQVELRKNYMNLTAKEADVRTDIEAQCMALKQQQDNEESIKRVIENAVEAQNQNITVKMTPSVYVSLIGKIPTDEIVSRIIARGNEIREMERLAAERKAAQEATSDSQSEEKPEQVEQIQEPGKMPEISSESISEKQEIYRVTYVVTGTESQVKAVSQFLQNNGIGYKVEGQFIIS